jgi:uncharacterized repeat protein (TIGR01451 family)
MKIILSIWTISALAFVTLFSASNVAAQYGQYGQYGYGGAAPSQMILIDKMVGKPVTQTKGGTTAYEYVDNLSTNDTRFKPGQEVAFKLVVKNTSSVKLTQVQVKDVLPPYVEAIEGPGEYNTQTKTISLNAGDLNPGEEKTYYLKVKLIAQNAMPADKGLFCLLNTAEAVSGQAKDDDTAQFCVEKEVTGAPQVPAAGPAMGLPLLFGQASLLGLGIYLKRRLA